MRYLGGKARIAKWLCAAITPVRKSKTVWDAFCGGLSVSVELSLNGPVISSDANKALIATYQAVAAGWDPPQVVTEEQFRAGKALPDTDPMKAFMGFGCAFGGLWYQSFARDKTGTNYAAQTRRGLQADVGALVAAGGSFFPASFMDIEPDADASNYVLYLDPPYAGTVGYGATGQFNHARFYERVRQWGQLTDVFVSEYAMPFGRPVLEFKHNMALSGGQKKDARTERLFHFAPDRPLEWSRKAE